MTDNTELTWVLVEAISTYRMRYMVQVPKHSPEWALDTVTMEDAKEFSQLHLGETIVSSRTLSEDEALTLFDTDNDYLKTWNTDEKLNAAFTYYIPHKPLTNLED